MVRADDHPLVLDDRLFGKVLALRTVEDMDPAVSDLDVGAAGIGRPADRGHRVMVHFDRRVGSDDLEHLLGIVLFVHGIRPAPPEDEVRDLGPGAQALGHEGLDLQLGVHVEADDRPVIELDLAPALARSENRIAGTEGQVQSRRLGRRRPLAKDHRILAVVFDVDQADMAVIEFFRPVDQLVVVRRSRGHGRRQEKPDEKSPHPTPLSHGCSPYSGFHYSS